MKERNQTDRQEALMMKRKEIKGLYKSLAKTLTLVMVAMFTLVMVSIAWFVANSKVQSASNTVGATDGNRFSLATLKDDQQGVYDSNSETSTDTPLAKALNRFFRVDKNGRDDKEGNYYTSFLDLPNLNVGTTYFEDINGGQYILGDTETVSLMVSGTSNVNNTEEFGHVGPGSYGQFTFYVIPHQEGFNRVTISVSLQPYTLIREGQPNDKTATGRAVRVKNNENNEVLLNMLQGHILLFTGKETDGDYKERVEPALQSDGSIRFEFSIDSSTRAWVKDKAEPVTVYWIWPKRFENIKYIGQEDSVFKTSCQSYTDLLSWMNTNRQTIVNTKTVNDLTSLANPIESMTNKQLAQWSVGYNKGDQLIGDNIAFFQWVIDAK